YPLGVASLTVLARLASLLLAWRPTRATARGQGVAGLLRLCHDEEATRLTRMTPDGSVPRPRADSASRSRSEPDAVSRPARLVLVRVLSRARRREAAAPDDALVLGSGLRARPPAHAWPSGRRRPSIGLAIGSSAVTVSRGPHGGATEDAVAP